MRKIVIILLLWHPCSECMQLTIMVGYSVSPTLGALYYRTSSGSYWYAAPKPLGDDFWNA